MLLKTLYLPVIIVIFKYEACILQFLVSTINSRAGVAKSVSYLTTDWMTGQGQRIFPLASMSRSALGPTQPLYDGYRGSFP
jgi:hypothetical protein